MFDDPRSSDDPRDRAADARERDPIDPREAFVDKLHLPTGPDREIVRCKGNVTLDAPSYWMGNYEELWATPSHDEVATPSKFVFPTVSKVKP